MNRPLLISTTLALTTLAGCASPAPKSLDRSLTLTKAAPAEPLAALRALAAAPAAQAPTDLGPPPGLDPALADAITRGTAGLPPQATTSLADAIALFAPQATAPKPTAAEEPTEEDRDEATRRYVAGRQKLLSGEHAEAVLDLREATDLDPTDPAPWRELGEALLAGGNRADAIDAFRSAVGAGETSPRILELMGRWAAERQDYKAAAAWYARASQHSPDRFDPVLGQLVHIGLSQSLRREGYLVASKDALRRALSSTTVLSSSTRYARDAGEIFRRQGDLWRDVGDDELRLGQPQAAIDAYARAAEWPSLDGEPLTPRVVYAHTRAGTPAAGAIWLLESMQDRSGRLGEGDLAMLRHLARAPGVGPAIAQDLDAYLRAAPRPPSAQSAITRAQAAVLPPAKARPILRAQLTADPSDARLARALIATHDNPSDAVAEAISLSTAAPRTALSLADGLLSSTLDLDPITAALARQSAIGPITTHAYVLALQGRLTAALDRLRPLINEPTVPAPVALTFADLCVSAGLAIPADLPERLAAPASTDSLRAKGRILALQQRFADATPIVFNLADAPAPDITPALRLYDLLSAADAAITLNQIPRAQDFLAAARRLDPGDDRPVGMLMSLFGPGGPASSQASLNLLIRELRTDLSDSRTVRLLRAREALRRGLITQAQREAFSLAREDAGDAAAIDTLVSAWQRQQGSTRAQTLQQGQEWVDAALTRRPLSPTLLGAWATIAVAQDRAAEAANRLRAALAEGAGPDASRILESLLRDQLKSPDEADTIALARLSAEPQAINAALELAELRVRRREDDAAVTVIDRAMQGPIALTADQSTRLGTLLNQVIRRAVELRQNQAPRTASPEARVAALRLLDIASQRSVRVPIETHQLRIILLTLDTTSTADVYIRAIQTAQSQHPTSTPGLLMGTVQTLAQQDRPAVALDVLDAIAPGTLPSPEIAQLWVQFMAVAGAPARAKAMIDTLALRDPTTLKALATRFADPSWAPSITEPRAELAYILANSFQSEGRTADADEAYRLALAYQPNHPWAANNYGYALADRKENLEEAERLLEIALSALPTEAAIIDSLGWLRYKQGVLVDRNDPATGALEKRGALSLLLQAAATDHGKGDATILDHAADACWLAGRFEEARRLWSEASRIAAEDVRRATAPGERRAPSPAALAEARRILESTRQKIADADAGNPVRVAPMHADPNPRPRRQPPPLANPAQPRTDEPQLPLNAPPEGLLPDPAPRP